MAKETEELQQLQSQRQKVQEALEELDQQKLSLEEQLAHIRQQTSQENQLVAVCSLSDFIPISDLPPGFIEMCFSDHFTAV